MPLSQPRFWVFGDTCRFAATFHMPPKRIGMIYIYRDKSCLGILPMTSHACHRHTQNVWWWRFQEILPPFHWFAYTSKFHRKRYWVIFTMPRESLPGFCQNTDSPASPEMISEVKLIPATSRFCNWGISSRVVGRRHAFHYIILSFGYITAWIGWSYFTTSRLSGQTRRLSVTITLLNVVIAYTYAYFSDMPPHHSTIIMLEEAHSHFDAHAYEKEWRKWHALMGTSTIFIGLDASISGIF